MPALSDLMDRLRARLPVVPRSTRDDLAADHAALLQKYEAIGGDDPAVRELLVMLRDPDVEPYLRFAPPGHFYSPIPNRTEALEFVKAVHVAPPTSLPGIDLRLDGQLALAADLAEAHADFDPPAAPTEGTRYFADNPAFGLGDAAIFQAMLRHFRPRRVIEIGSGYSSALLLDVVDEHLEGDVEVTFIEPYDELLLSLLRPQDLDRVELVNDGVQQVDQSRFDALESGDILFIDSTHVARTGSDVNHEVFEILPRLAPGVIVHFHDMFHPFEYPGPWISEGRAWNEAYLLRAFLQHNDAYEILLFPHQLHRLASEQLQEVWPAGGGGTAALWLRRSS